MIQQQAEMIVLTLQHSWACAYSCMPRWKACCNKTDRATEARAMSCRCTCLTCLCRLSLNTIMHADTLARTGCHAYLLGLLARISSLAQARSHHSSKTSYTGLHRNPPSLAPHAMIANSCCLLYQCLAFIYLRWALFFLSSRHTCSHRLTWFVLIDAHVSVYM